VVVIEVYTLTSISNALPLTGGTVTGASTFNSTLTVNGAAVSGFTGFKNRIINPGMVIDQRNAGASTSVPNATIVYGADRTLVYEDTGASSCTVQQVADAPSGFVNSLRFTVGTGSTATAAQLAVAEQRIEGFNFADSAYGTASAQTFTLSFWVKSSLTGTYCVGLRNASDNRSYVATYTINSASTWEFKTITIAGDTSGTWGTGNGIGISVRFDLGSGSNYQTSTLNSWQAGLLFSNSAQANLIGTSSATWQITGVQLERGSNATSFEFRDYGRELILCQRYCLVYWNNIDGEVRFFGFNFTTTTALPQIYFPVQTRTKPTGVSVSTPSGFTLYSAGTSFTPSAIALDNSSTKTANLTVTASGLTQNAGCIFGFQASGNKMELTGMEL
jgi:hypothetical protein